MTDHIQKFDASTVRDAVTDRIKASFLELIPEEAWKGLVATEITAFTEDRRHPHSSQVIEAPLKKLIREELDRRFRARIKEELDKPEYALLYDAQGQQQPGDAVKAIVEAMAPALVNALFAGVVDQAMWKLKQSLQQ